MGNRRTFDTKMDSKGKGRATDDMEETNSARQSLMGPPKQSVGIIAIGMAGSGKTTLIHRLTSYLHGIDKAPYVLNLDPAVVNLGYEANIDIRDTVDYKEVMKQYNLGPNGGILTALNLFTTKFDQVLSYVDKKVADKVPYVLLDTPGQIEIFTWSASGAIITDAMASSLPTVVAYIIDTPRTAAPETFMSNMLYACSILYKTKLPFILVFNKTDVKDWLFAQEWMQDFESFQDALMRRKSAGSGGGEDGEGDVGEGGFMTSLMSSMSLVLEEFYKNLRACGVSAMTGQGMEDFFDKVEEARQEYEEIYKPELLKVQADRAAAKEASKQAELEKVMRDMKVSVPLGADAATSGAPSGKEVVGGKSGAQPVKKGKKSAAELLAELEEQEKLEEELEAEEGWKDYDEEEDIYREDHRLYPNLRREQESRSGIASKKAGLASSVPTDGETDSFGGKWPRPA